MLQEAKREAQVLKIERELAECEKCLGVSRFGIGKTRQYLSGFRGPAQRGESPGQAKRGKPRLPPRREGVLEVRDGLSCFPGFQQRLS